MAPDLVRMCSRERKSHFRVIMFEKYMWHVKNGSNIDFCDFGDKESDII